MKEIDEIMLNFVNELDFDQITQMFCKISSGKKLRSKMILRICGKNDNSLKLCAIIELIHLASLLHDDVIDDSHIRRGNPSINATYGYKNSIMLGDILYSKAFFELNNFDKDIAKIVSNAVCKLSIGELLDVKLSENFNEDEEKYMQMIYHKTSALIEASSICGAIIANYDVKDFEIYGKNLGLAFQIIDDVLDISKDEKTLGKPAFNDFKDGKTTLPYIYLYEKLSPSDKEILKNFHSKKLSNNEINFLKSKFSEFDIINKTINKAEQLSQKALQAIQKYSNFELENMAKNIINRNK